MAPKEKFCKKLNNFFGNFCEYNPNNPPISVPKIVPIKVNINI